MTAPAVEMFDDWYEAIADSSRWDPIVQRLLGLPPDLESTGYLNGPGLVEVQQRLDLRPGDTLVDLGCGRAGYGLASIASGDVRLIGIDFSAAALRAAAAAAKRLHLSHCAKFRQAELEDTGLPEGSADAVLCVDAFHFARSIPAAAAEAARILKPGGRIVITTWEAADPTLAHQLPERIARMDLGRELTAAGLVEVKVIDRPAWSRHEISFWTAAAGLEPDNDRAIAALRDEALEFLPIAEALQRRLVVARRGHRTD